MNLYLKRLPEPTELQSHQKDPLEIPSPKLDMCRIINVKKAEGRTTSDVVVKTAFAQYINSLYPTIKFELVFSDNHLHGSSLYIYIYMLLLEKKTTNKLQLHP